MSITLILYLKDKASIATATMVDRYVSHASIHKLKLPLNILNALLFC